MKRPKCNRIRKTSYQLGGFMADYLKGITEQWLLVAPYANPGMLEMFRDRDATPLRNLEAFSGELAGKYLTGAVQVLTLTGDARLKARLKDFVACLISYQADDGYLGPWPKHCRLENRRPDGTVAWDTWGHYHIMLGLMLWHEETGDRKALDCVVRIADMICRKYLGQKKQRLVDTLRVEMNMAPVHALCILHRKTRDEKYLRMALQIVDEFAAKGKDGLLAGDWFRMALAGRDFYESPKPRWESLHSVMALAELYCITGDDRCRRAYEHIWWSLGRTDRHNTGGLTAGERAQGNPYDLLPIETCCTIAWIALSVEMLKMTGDSRVADEIELSTLNSVVGMHSSTGRWSTYDTPMAGFRKASVCHISWQGRESTPELNCCSVNSNRGFGMISDWGLMKDKEAVLLNYYGPSLMTAKVARGLTVTLTQETEYPLAGSIAIRVAPSKAAEFCLKLRIPYWSARTRVKLNGETIRGVKPGRYLALDRKWKKGDRVEIGLDMSLHFWRGERECKGLTSIYRGPMLLAYDHRYNLELAAGKKVVRDYVTWWEYQDSYLRVPALDARNMRLRAVAWKDWLPPLMLFEVKAADGRTVRLCDFASAGEVGTPYRTWLPIKNAPRRVEFSPDNPLRSARG